MKSYVVTKLEPMFWRKAERKARRWGGAPTLDSMKGTIYAAVRAKGNAGATCADVSIATGMSTAKCRAVINEFRRAGYLIEVIDPAAVIAAYLPADEAVQVALLVLEAALVRVASERGITDEMRRSFATYQKCKELMLRPGTASEGRAAQRAAVLSLIKTVL